MAERILLIGSGGREHALAYALKKSASCEKLWCAPGNPGIGELAELVPLDVQINAEVATWCVSNGVTLCVVGPELPLANGLTNVLREYGISVFGPSQAAAQLESSKGFAKDFMQRHEIPTSTYKRFGVDPLSPNTIPSDALEYVSNHPLPVVIKYDGLAAGKGVVVATARQEALKALEEMFEGAFGRDGVVVESFLIGHEASVFAISDGTNYVVLAPSQDHKRIGDGNTGKNTGGMGAYAPAALVTDGVMLKVRQRIIEPTLRGMASEGNTFVGCLYCGVMIDDEGDPYVVEYNSRFGDPETQVVLPILDADFAALLASAARGDLKAVLVKTVATRCAVTVVMASGGYPDSYEKGFPVSGIDKAQRDSDVLVFQSGTISSEDGVVTSGGRVLSVTAMGNTMREARERAYAATAKIEFKGSYFRKDIAASE